MLQFLFLKTCIYFLVVSVLVAARGILVAERGRSRCRARAESLPACGPGVETVSLALPGRFLTPGPGPPSLLNFFLKSEIKNRIWPLCLRSCLY